MTKQQRKNQEESDLRKAIAPIFPKEKRALIEQITFAFYDVERLCGKFGGWRDIRESVEIAAKQERKHRALGRRMNQSLKGRAPIEVCARLFAVRGFLTSVSKRSYEAREDFVAAYRAAAEVERSPEGKEAYKALQRKLKALDDISYTDLT